MRHAPRWMIAVAVAILIVALIALARGPEHRRGDDVGAVAGSATIVSPGEASD